MTATVPLRQRLVNHLVEHGMIRSPWVRQAFADTPREVFVPRFRRRYPDHGMVDGADPGQADVWIENVYTDQVLVVQVKPARDGATAPTSSSSEPTVMAGMLEALDLRPGHRVLEIGTGTGYNAALLCHRVGAANLTSIELDPALASAARDALASIGLHPRVHAGDGAAGLAMAGPFDRIIATAATDHIPSAWINQLAPGGAILTDLRGSVAGSLIRLTAPSADDQVDDQVEVEPEDEVDTVEGRFLTLPGAFMPMRTHADSPYRDGEHWDRVVYDFRNPQHATTSTDPTLVAGNPSLRFLIQLHLAGHRLRISRRAAPDNDLAGHAADASSFTVDFHPDEHGRYRVAQTGPQRLWDTVEAAHALWLHLGRPRIERFGVTAHDTDHQYIWYDQPDSGYRWPLPL
jgi:protein-L-isoaspartate(D-aspartate) O-methyltransferase